MGLLFSKGHVFKISAELTQECVDFTLPHSGSLHDKISLASFSLTNLVKRLDLVTESLSNLANIIKM